MILRLISSLWKLAGGVFPRWCRGISKYRDFFVDLDLWLWKLSTIRLCVWIFEWTLRRFTLGVFTFFSLRKLLCRRNRRFVLGLFNYASRIILIFCLFLKIWIYCSSRLDRNRDRRLLLLPDVVGCFLEFEFSIAHTAELAHGKFGIDCWCGRFSLEIGAYWSSSFRDWRNEALLLLVFSLFSLRSTLLAKHPGDCFLFLFSLLLAVCLLKDRHTLIVLCCEKIESFSQLFESVVKIWMFLSSHATLDCKPSVFW